MSDKETETPLQKRVKKHCEDGDKIVKEIRKRKCKADLPKEDKNKPIHNYSNLVKTAHDLIHSTIGVPADITYATYAFGEVHFNIQLFEENEEWVQEMLANRDRFEIWGTRIKTFQVAHREDYGGSNKFSEMRIIYRFKK